MKSLLFRILILICLCSGNFLGLSQNSELVHLKTFNGGGPSLLTNLNQDDAYVLTIRNPDDQLDPGIFSPFEPITTELSYLILLYDSDFEFLGNFELNAGFNLIQPVKRLDNNWMFNSSVYPGSLGNFESIPALDDSYPSVINGLSSVLVYDSEENSLEMPLHCQCYTVEDFIQNSPIEGFRYSADAEGQKPINRYFGAYVNDNNIITSKYLRTGIELNWNDSYTIENGFWGSVWIKLDPISGTYIAVPIYDDTGSVLNHALFPSEDGNHVFRAGILKGNDLQLSPDGSLWNVSETDTMFYSFLLKENLNGELQWINPLYAYNNTSSASVTFNTQTENLSLVQINASEFLSHSARFSLSDADTLVFSDFFGNEGFIPNSDDNSTVNLTYGSHSIFKFNDGQPDIWLEYQLLLDQSNHPMNVADQQYPYLFKVGENLAWVHNYISQTDTTIHYTRHQVNGQNDIVSVNLPGGQGAYIVFFNPNLEILDVLVLPYDGNFFPGMNINHVSTYNEDTLLIQGEVFPGVTSTLDPSLESESIAFNSVTSFIGFYSVPDVLNSTDQGETESEHFFKIYPNPSSRVNVFLETSVKSEISYTIFDARGSIVGDGVRPAGNDAESIDLSFLEPGIYFIRFHSKEIHGTAKVVRL